MSESARPCHVARMEPSSGAIRGKLGANAVELRSRSASLCRLTAIKLSRHSGMDRRNPDCRDADNLCHPWSLGSGDPCRNDAPFLNLMAVPPWERGRPARQNLGQDGLAPWKRQGV